MRVFIMTYIYCILLAIKKYAGNVLGNGVAVQLAMRYFRAVRKSGLDTLQLQYIVYR